MPDVMTVILCLLMATLLLVAAAVVVAVRFRRMDLWIGSYFGADRARRRRVRRLNDATVEKPLHVFLAVCDHFEPEWGSADRQTALERVRRWQREYPRLFAEFSDSDGRPPVHTFFFPQDQYRPEYLDLLAELCAQGWGDVDVHLHHDADSPQALREKLESFRETLRVRHGLLREDPRTGRAVYGFIHGNWALCNARPDGRHCGVNGEIPILLETGCYADFTMPAAPDASQVRTINSIYYASDRPGCSRSHERGIPARVGYTPPSDSLLMIQGPLCPDWASRKWGLFPRLENADLHQGRPPDLRRFALWLDVGVHVEGRPDWLFVKLHTHGCKPGNLEELLGPRMQAFHRGLRRLAEQRPGLRYHYVTAWEMAQLVHQAESGLVVPDIELLRHTPVRLS